MAEGLAHLEGMIFFDTSGNLPTSYHQPLSIVTASPVDLFLGSMDDFEALQARYHQRMKGSDGGAFPDGALCGWIDYEGCFAFGDYPELLVYHHEEGRWYSNGSLEEQWREPAVSTQPLLPIHWDANLNQSEYLEMVAKAQEYIASGDIYQVNLAQKFTAEVAADLSLWPVYESLREASPSPMASYLSLGGRELLCSSPETFLRMSGRHLETRPIKGTRPRYSDPEKDERSRVELASSEKESAELVMITDLLRNDLGQVSEYGSVSVPELLQPEKLEQVYHLVSTVTGQLREELNHLHALQACLPGGSITGAPKKRATELIAELEPNSRGLYTGVMGYLGYNGESQFNIIIRSLVREGKSLSYHVGAGIVADSDPLAEYEETLHKAKGVRKAIFGG